MRLASVIDSALEATIIGSFSKTGIAARRRLLDWDPVDVDLTGTRAVVTGATSGIGRAVAEGLADLGAHTIVTSRDLDRARDAADEISTSTDRGSASGVQLQTGDFESIRDAAAEMRAAGPIDVLIHNAGALTDDYRTSEFGMELTLASHLVGPYALTRELRPDLSSGARVLWMSSGGMYTQKLDLQKLEMDEHEYRGAIAYARAKRAQVEMVAHLGPQWAPDVVMHAMHPGWVDTPGVDAGLPGFGRVMGPILRTPEQGADTMVWLAATGGEGAPAGSFWLDRRTRGRSYLPRTGTDDATRRELVEWLDLVSLPAAVA